MEDIKIGDHVGIQVIPTIAAAKLSFLRWFSGSIGPVVSAMQINNQISSHAHMLG